ncbi:MAG: gliding motility-associated C-terminal domain-containing protein [Salibacteraceae bacterium]
MKKTLFILFFLIELFAWPKVHAQTIELDRQLIGSGYSEFGEGEFYLSASVGEPIVSTQEQGSFVITQGFQQSNYVLNNPFILELSAADAACIGANDGAVSISFISENIATPLTYQWSNGSNAEQITQLEVGLYSLTVTGSNGNAVTNSITVGAVDSIDCTPKFYSGITPNGDDFNDYWHVENSDFFNEKSVEIFNRYGALVWSANNYDNSSASFTGLHKNGNPLPDGTYFYIAKFDGSTYKGWIEVSR